MKLYIIIIKWHVAVIIVRVLVSGALLTEAEWGTTDVTVSSSKKLAFSVPAGGKTITVQQSAIFVYFCPLLLLAARNIVVVSFHVG